MSPKLLPGTGGFTPRKTGFTLIELLVVIAIIAILAALIFPVFASARAKGRQTACASNMRQIGIALRMYSDDFDGEMPRTSHDHAGSPVVWILSLAPYVQNVHAIRACPSDQRADEIKGAAGTSYVLNEYVAVPQVDPFGNPIPDPEVFTGLDTVPRPSETIMLFELSDEKRRDSYWDHTHSRSWFHPGNTTQARWQWILSEVEVDRHRSGSIAHAPDVSNANRRTRYDRTQGVANYLYCDTHVKAIPAGRIKGWADSGFNFAKPLR